MSSMKKTVCILLILILIVSVSLGVFACGKASISSDEPYYRYAYDARSDSFIKTSAALVFKDNFSTFEYSFGGGDLIVYGAVEHTDAPDSYIITCNDEMVALVTERYRESLIANGADDSKLALFDAVAANITPRSQYFAYDGKLFTGDAVELFREPEADSDSFEGVYRMDSADDLVRLRGGFAYSKDENGEFTVKSGRYTVSRGILTFVSIDGNGKDKYANGILMRKRYYMAKITIPSDATLLDKGFEEQLESSPFATKINADISAYAGKTIAVLCDSFFSNEMQ